MIRLRSSNPIQSSHSLRLLAWVLGLNSFVDDQVLKKGRWVDVPAPKLKINVEGKDVVIDGDQSDEERLIASAKQSLNGNLRELLFP